MAGEFYKPGLNDKDKVQAKLAKEQGASIQEVSDAFQVTEQGLRNMFPEWFDDEASAIAEAEAEIEED